MEKPPPNADILDWYVNKLYKKALDHCLQQQSTKAPTSGQGQNYRGHVQGHSNDKRQVCNTTLKCDLSKYARTVQNGGANHQETRIQGQTSNLHGQVCRSGKEVKHSNQENLFYQNTAKGICQKQQQSSRFHVNNVLSEQGHILNNNTFVCEPEITVTRNSHMDRQYRKETENFYQESTERGIIQNIESNDTLYRQKVVGSQQNPRCSNSRFSEPALSHVLTQFPDTCCQRSQHLIVKKSDCHRNGRCETQESESPMLRQDEKDLAWFRHSVLPQQTNTQVPLRRWSFSKDDTVLYQCSLNTEKILSNFHVSSHLSVDTKRDTNNMVSCQHSHIASTEKRSSQSTSNQISTKRESRGLESSCLYSDKTNSQNQPSAFSKDRPVENISLNKKNAPNFKSSVLFNLKSHFHNSNADAENHSYPNLMSERGVVTTEHSSKRVEQKSSDLLESKRDGAHLQSHCKCDVNDITEPHDVLECSQSAKSGPAGTHTEDTSVECTGLQSHEREELGIPITDPDDSEIKKITTSGPLITQLTDEVLEKPVGQLSDTSHNLSSTNETEPMNSMTSVPNSSQVVSCALTNESLKLHIKALCDTSPSQERGVNFSHDQDKGEDSDSGDSCKSGIVIKPGHSNQKRKRSLSLDQNSCKRQSSGTSKERSACPQNTRKVVKGSVKVNKSGEKLCHDKNADKGFKSKKGMKHVDVSKTQVKRKKDGDLSNGKVKRKKDSDLSNGKVKGKKDGDLSNGKAKGKKDVNVSKTKEEKKADKSNFKIFDVSEKKIDPRMSEHVKRCLGREISILQAHEDQAMSTDTESVGQSSDSNTMSSLAFLDLKDLAQVPEPCKSKENQSVYMSKKHVGGVWKSIVKKQ